MAVDGLNQPKMRTIVSDFAIFNIIQASPVLFQDMIDENVTETLHSVVKLQLQPSDTDELNIAADY